MHSTNPPRCRDDSWVPPADQDALIFENRTVVIEGLHRGLWSLDLLVDLSKVKGLYGVFDTAFMTVGPASYTTWTVGSRFLNGIEALFLRRTMTRKPRGRQRCLENVVWGS
jgi:hypothetical protein